MPGHGRTTMANSLLLTPDEVAATTHTKPTPFRPITTAKPARRIPARLLEVLGVAVLVLLALGVRAFALPALPFGLHGDEAVAGMEAQRIMREGNIGPYSSEALGQPAGPLYLTALAIKLLGNTILALRIVPALLGTLTVLALYVVARRACGVATALFASGLLATLSWHVHFARIGFPLEAWPLCVVLASGALLEALRRQSLRWWALAGVLAGLGVYSYNAHTLFLAIFGIFIALVGLAGIANPGRAGRKPYILGPTLLGLLLLAAAAPLIDYARVPTHEYFAHSQQVTITRTPEWQELGSRATQAQFLAERYRDFWRTACCLPVMDGVDGAGLTPLTPPALLVLAALGAFLGLYRRQPLAFLAVLVVLLLPLASVITVNGLARRTLALAPFLVLLAALPLGWLAEQGWRRWRRATPPNRVGPTLLIVAPLLALAFLGPYSLDRYSQAFVASQEKDWVFGVELVDAINYLNTLPADTYVYFLSDRWSFDYETRRFLAPHFAGEDRSAVHGARHDLRSERTSGTIVYLLFGEYTAGIEELRAQYPQGTTTVGSQPGPPPFVAYRVDFHATAQGAP